MRCRTPSPLRERRCQAISTRRCAEWRGGLGIWIFSTCHGLFGVYFIASPCLHACISCVLCRFFVLALRSFVGEKLPPIGGNDPSSYPQESVCVAVAFVQAKLLGVELCLTGQADTIIRSF